MTANIYSLSKYFLLIFICTMHGYATDLLPSETNIQSYFTKIDSVLESNLRLVDCIYVLNLAERESKWKNTQEQLQPYPILYNRFPAINGWKIPQDQLNIFWQEQGFPADNHPMPPGKLGCILSHLSIIQDGFDRGFNHIWILQDDIEVLRDVTEIDSYIEQITELDPEWGLLFTDLNMREYVTPFKPWQASMRKTIHSSDWYKERPNLSETFQEIRMRVGFHSVILSRKGMELILNYFKHIQLVTSFDIDVHCIPNLHKYGLRNPLVSNSRSWILSDSSEGSSLSLPNPYNQLQSVLPYYPHGWYSNQKEIEKIFHKHKPKVVVELGSWLGVSTCHMADLLRGSGKLYAIDHWLGSTEHHEAGRTDISELLPTLYEQFLSNVMHRGLTNTIIPWRMTTEQAAHKMRDAQTIIDLIYIDASHDEKSVYEDLSNWYPLVRKKGIICGNDWSWGNGYPVRRAVQRFAREKRVKVHVANNNFWLFYKR